MSSEDEVIDLLSSSEDEGQHNNISQFAGKEPRTFHNYKEEEEETEVEEEEEEEEGENQQVDDQVEEEAEEEEEEEMEEEGNEYSLEEAANDLVQVHQSLEVEKVTRTPVKRQRVDSQLDLVDFQMKEVAFEKETDELRYKLAKVSAENESLHDSIRKARQKETQLNEFLQSRDDGMNDLESFYEREISDLKVSNITLQAENKELLLKINQITESLNAVTKSKALESSDLEKHLNQVIRENHDLKKRIQSMSNREFEVESLKSKLRSKESELSSLHKSLTIGPMELKQIQGELNDSKLQIAQISKEKSALASKIQNQELLKSKISDLELKLQRSEVQLEEMTKSRAECSEFFDNWNVWKNSLHDVFGNDIENIPKIVKHILDQKIESQNLLDQLQETHSNLQSTYSTNEQLKQLTNEHESNLKSLKQYIQDLESEKESVNIALFTANKRIESFNHLLNALETKNLDSLPDFDSKVDNETDKLLLKFQEVIKEKDEASGISRNLSKRLDVALTEIEILKARLGRGEYSNTMTKVLHLAKAPKSSIVSTEQSTDVAGLKKSLEESKQKIQLLESELLDSVKSRDRLKTVYHSITQNFKQAYFKITGLSIDAVESNRFAVSSMYIQDPDEYLMFEIKSNKSHAIEKIRFSKSKSKSQSGLLNKYMDSLSEKNEETDIFPIIIAQMVSDLWQMQS